MEINKNALIRSYAQSMGIEAAKELINKKINAAALEEKEHYTEEETAKICGELIEEGGLIRIVAQNFVVQLERKRSEEQALLLDNIETQIWYLTDKETYGVVNKAHVAFLGMEKEKLEGRDLHDIISVEEAEACIANNREVFEKKKQSHTEEWVKNGRGETRLLSITRTPKIDDNGTVEYVICAAEDITELKKAEEALLESEERYRLLAESAQDYIFIIDSDIRIQYSNQFAAGQLGYRPEEIIGKHLEEVFSPDLSSSFKHNLQTVFESGEPLHVEDRFTLPDKELWLDTRIIPLKTEHGEIKSILGISRDISERKQSDDERERLIKKLGDQDKLKKDFLNVAYHEMRSPLAPIVGYASLLEQSELTEKQKKYVHIIVESTYQLEELIDTLLEVTRLEAGKAELSLEKMPIPEIVNNLLERFEPQADAKRQTISTVVPEGTEVEGDKQKITAIFDNLISNAIKYTGEKGRIDLVVEDRQEEISVCVADTGIGILEAQLPMVFERFYTADTPLAGKGGLGLGLAIVKGYVKLHGGKVWVTSEFGKGSKFWFTLPKRQR